jgi:Spy/CpxP family protein refolding chaperone
MKREFLAKGQEMKKTREEIYDQMIGFMRSPSIDQAALSSSVEKGKVRLDDLNSFLFAKFTEFHDMLTPEQREKAAKEMEHWKEKYQEYHKDGTSK